MPSPAEIALGVVIVLHGLVHAWYVVLSRGWVEYEEAMGWNGHSWLLSRALPERTVLDVASVLYALVAGGFVVGGIGVLLSSPWWGAVVVGSAALSAATIVGMWDGRATRLVEKGAVGVLIDVGLVGWLLVAG